MRCSGWSHPNVHSIVEYPLLSQIRRYEPSVLSSSYSTGLRQPNNLLLCSQSANKAAGLPLLFLYPMYVLSADGIPRRHILLHAAGHAGLFGLRQTRSGLWDAALEAMLVDFLERIRNRSLDYVQCHLDHIHLLAVSHYLWLLLV